MISYQHSLAFNGFAIVPFLYTAAEIQAILSCISQADSSRETFRKTSDLFAIPTGTPKRKSTAKYRPEAPCS